MLLEHDADFQSLVGNFLDQIAKWKLAPDSTIVSLALDNGRFSVAAARKFPHCTVVHAGAGGYMTDLVNIKRRREGLENMVVMNRGMDEITLKMLRDARAIVFIDVLSTYRPSRLALKNAFESLKPGGRACLCEYRCAPHGHDWDWSLLKQNLRTHGLRKTLDVMLRGRSVLKRVRQTHSRVSASGAVSTPSGSLEADVHAAGLQLYPTAAMQFGGGAEKFVLAMKGDARASKRNEAGAGLFG